MTENANTPAPVVDPNAAKLAKLATGIMDRITSNQDEIERAFESMDIAETEGSYPAALKASKAFGLTAAEVTSWRPGARTKVSSDPVENAVRTAHNIFKPQHSPQTRTDFARILRLVCHAAGEEVVADARGKGEGQFRQKNLPVVTDATRKEDANLATRAASLAALKAEVEKLRGSNNPAIVFKVDPIAATQDAEALAALNKQLASLAVQGGMFQASLLTHLIEDAFQGACEDRGVKVADVWRGAATKAKAALASAAENATTQEVLKAMRDAAVLHVAQSALSENTVKAVISTAEQVATAEKAVYSNLRKLFALGKINQEQLDECISVMTAKALKDEVGEENIAKEAAKQLREETAARKREEDAKRAEEQKAAKELAAKSAPPVQASESGEAAATAAPTKRGKAKFAPAPVAPVVPDTADTDRDAAIAELDNA